MYPTNEQLNKLILEVTKSSNNPDFIHLPWFVDYHLKIVQQIALELINYYPKANKETVIALTWIHDYGKTIDFKNQYETTYIKGKELMIELGFSHDFTNKIINYSKTLDNHSNQNLSDAPIELQIVSSADGCAHFVGPFMSIYWWENPQKTHKELMQSTVNKANKDWNHKIVLPEARKNFESRYKYIIEQSGRFPKHFIKPYQANK